jgi:hypothetical protein
MADHGGSNGVDSLYRKDAQRVPFLYEIIHVRRT